MFASTVSRWTMAHFAAALGFFLLAQAAMIGGVTFPVTDLMAPTTLATVHLLTIGWVTILMLGALHQFVPVITAGGSAPDRSALISLVAIVIGLAGMETGFLALGGILAPPSAILLPAGGSLVLTGAAIAVVALARILWQTRPLGFSACFIAAGLLFLLATVILGILLGLTFAAPGLLPWPGALSDGVRLHLLAGLIGWFTLTAVGVSYRLLSMFTLAPEERGLLGAAVSLLSIGGLTTAWLLALGTALGIRIPDIAVTTALVATAIGLTLYLIDTARLYRARRRRQLELNTGMAVPALLSLALSLGLAACAFGSGDNETLVGAASYLFLFGWLSGLAISQLYKIVPFLTWLERYGSVLGKQAVPRVQDLVDERRDRPWFQIYFAAVAAGTVCIVAGQPTLWRIAVAAHFIATLMIVWALWRARHGAPQQPRAIAPEHGPATAPPPLGIHVTNRSHAS